MRMCVLATLLTASALAQIPPASPAAPCGPANISFKVSLNESQHALVTPEPGKALVYFIHDAGTNWTVRYPTVKVAIDGTWVGANHGNSYFFASVDPGEHHMCITLQSTAVWARSELAHFTAAADTVYYYRTRLFITGGGTMLELAPLDTDQVKYLVASFPMAVASPKK